MEEFYDKIQTHFLAELPFVVYRKPKNSKVTTLLQKTDKVYVLENFKASGFVFAPFHTSDKTVFFPLENSKMLQIPFEEEELETIPKKNLQENEEEKQQHIQLVQKGIDAILQNKLQKVVLSRSKKVEANTTTIFFIFKRLLQQYTNAFVYCWYHPKIGLWLGATPETLVQVTGRKMKTMALAGTQKYRKSQSIVWQEKEIEEQEIVTNYIVNTMQNWVKNISVSKPKTSRAGSLVHLETEISGCLVDTPNALKELLLRLHPTPAVCGFPKEKAKQFIIANENYNRAYYTGFLGELNFKHVKKRNTNGKNVENNAYNFEENTTNLYVNLRCMQLQNQAAILYAGGGITNKSIPEKEWQETQNKLKTMCDVL